jgi:hypothetical protein
MKTLLMTVAVLGLVAQSVLADDPHLQQRLAEQRREVRTIMETDQGCAMMCEEMLKNKRARTMMIDTMLKDENAVAELKKRLK